MTQRRELAEALFALVGSSADGKKLAKALAAYLVVERRTKDVNSLLRNLEQLRLTRDGVLEVSAASARPLSAETIKAIKALFDEKHIIVHEQQDPSLIGGVRVRAHDRQLDLSVRTRLQRLKKGI